jgi:hypothetical protein
MKTKSIAIPAAILMTTSMFSTEYLLTLNKKHYENSISISVTPAEVPVEEIIVSPTSSVEVEGWNIVVQFGQEPIMTDLEWQEAVLGMKTGIKVVSGSSYAFISKSKLENANCFNITQALSLRSNNGYVHIGGVLFHHEAVGCNGTNLDYNFIHTNTYNVVYNKTGYWDEVVGNVNTGNALIYIY